MILSDSLTSKKINFGRVGGEDWHQVVKIVAVVETPALRRDFDGDVESGDDLGFVVGDVIGGGVVVEQLSGFVFDHHVLADGQVLENEDADVVDFFLEGLFLWFSHGGVSSVFP